MRARPRVSRVVLGLLVGRRLHVEKGKGPPAGALGKLVGAAGADPGVGPFAHKGNRIADRVRGHFHKIHFALGLAHDLVDVRTEDRSEPPAFAGPSEDHLLGLFFLDYVEHDAPHVAPHNGTGAKADVELLGKAAGALE